MRVQCSVCQELFGDSDFVMAPRCGHLFHKKCIREWANTKGTCPTCRQSTSITELIRIFLDFDRSVEVDKDLQQQLEEMTRERNIQVHIQRFADQELRKCRQLLSTSRLELKKTKKKLKEKEEQSSLAEEVIQIYTAEKAKRKEKLEALAESISSL